MRETFSTRHRVTKTPRRHRLPVVDGLLGRGLRLRLGLGLGLGLRFRRLLHDLLLLALDLNKLNLNTNCIFL